MADGGARQGARQVIEKRIWKEDNMIGMTLRCPATGIIGTVGAQVVQPDGKALARINDHWLEVENLRGA
jgi:hypothetical protein